MPRKSESWWTWRDSVLLALTMCMGAALWLVILRIDTFTGNVMQGHRRLDRVEARVVRMDNVLTSWTDTLRGKSLTLDTTGQVVERRGTRGKTIPWRAPK